MYSENNPNTFEKTYGMTCPMVIIPCGIPTAGKSTWVKENLIGFVSVSRDDIREQMYGKYKKIPFTKQSEQMVTNIFDSRMSDAIARKRNIVLDNTHCKASYLNAAIQRFSGTGYKIVVIFFDIPIWKAYFRNWKRKLQTGKWIPPHVIKQMYKNYKKINKQDYAKYQA